MQEDIKQVVRENEAFFRGRFDIAETLQGYNQYLGCSVNEMNQMDISASLAENGYCSNDLVFCLSQGRFSR